MRMWQRLWRDRAGFVMSTEMVLASSVLGLGMIVGMASLRDQVVQELGDVAQHISALDQSYSYAAIMGHHSYTAGTESWDQSDDCDAEGDQPGMAPVCIQFGHLEMDAELVPIDSRAGVEY